MLLRTLQVTEFQLHLKYEEIHLPRCGDVVIMEFDMGCGLGNEDLFLSDTVTAGQFKIKIPVSKSRSN